MTKIRHAALALVIVTILGCVSPGETIPPTFFGMHVNQSKTAWPNVAFGSYRLWDDGTAWANLNPSNNVYNWAPLDSWVNRAQQQNVQLLYTFGRTPAWASSTAM